MRSLGIFLLGIAVVGCKSRGNSAVKDFPDGAQGLPVYPVVMSLTDDKAAQAVFKAFNVQAQTGQGFSEKSIAGDVYLTCSTSGGIPEGAQGWPGPTSWSCAASIVSSMPEGAQGYPAPALMQVKDQAAMAIWEAFTVEKTVDQNGNERKYFTGKGYFKCTAANTGATCMLAGYTADADPGTGGIPNGAQGLPSNLGGGAGGIPPGAQGLPQTNGGMPPGAQGLPQTNGGMPPGAQGLPQQPRTNNGIPTGAQGLPQPARTNGGMPTGAQGLPAQPTNGGIPTGAQGLPQVPPTNGGIPTGAQGLPSNPGK